MEALNIASRNKQISYGLKVLFVNEIDGKIHLYFTDEHDARRLINNYLDGIDQRINGDDLVFKKREEIIEAYKCVCQAEVVGDEEIQKKTALRRFFINYMIWYDLFYPLSIPQMNQANLYRKTLLFPTVFGDNDPSPEKTYEQYKEKFRKDHTIYHWAVNDLSYTISTYYNNDSEVAVSARAFLQAIKEECKETKNAPTCNFDNYAHLLRDANLMLGKHLSSEPSDDMLVKPFVERLAQTQGKPSVGWKIAGYGLILLGACLFLASALFMAKTFLFGAPISIVGFVLSKKMVVIGSTIATGTAVVCEVGAKGCFWQGAKGKGAYRAGMDFQNELRAAPAA